MPLSKGNMHELPITKSIYQMVLKHAKRGNAERVISVNLEIGALSDLQDEWLQRYFDYLSRGTIADGAKLIIDRVPVAFQCNHCQQSLEVYSLLKDDLSCTQCGSREVTLVSGREYQVKNLEVQ